MTTTDFDVTRVPVTRPTQVCPDPETLDTLELLRARVYRPDVHAPIRIPVPEGASQVEVTDPEGVPLARLVSPSTSDRMEVRSGSQVQWLGRLSARPYERLYLPPGTAYAMNAVPVLVDRPVTDDDAARLATERPLLLLVLTGPSTAPSARSMATMRSALAVAENRPGSQVVAVPLSVDRAAQSPRLLDAVLSAYAPGDVRRLAPSSHRPSAARSGVVLYFTGLSGSGKSTVARAVRNTLLERDGLPVSLLDGDVVRRNLSAGLGFSPEDRETNIRRIGWVAAEIAYHGGLVICSPIAPYDATRRSVRQMVQDRGGRFLLVHVSTPVEECERRDRKGLYAKARAGEIPHFTGISAPYEEPQDAELTLDTSVLSVDEARDRVLALLALQGPLHAGTAGA